MGEKKKTLLLVGYFAMISLFEILAYKQVPLFSFLAAWIWLLTSIAIILYLSYEIIKKFVEDIKKGSYLNAGGYFLFVLFLLLCIGNVNYSDINPDATQQVEAGIESFKAADLNYTGTAFLGYPNRQYILTALPTLLFGRSIWSFQAGFGYLFILGISCLWLELRKNLQKYHIKEEYALLVPFSMLGFSFIIEYYLNFEQAIIPVILSMFGLAFYLRLRREANIKSFVFLAWTGCLLCNSYTPGLAFLGLLAALLIIYMIELYGNAYVKKNEQNKSLGKFGVFVKKVLDGFVILEESEPQKEENEQEGKTIRFHQTVRIIALIICMATFLCATMIPGRSDRINQVREEVSLSSFILESWEDFFTDKNVRFLGLFSGAVFVYVLLSLLCRFKIHDLTISVWLLGVIFFSNYLVGYTAYEKAWVMQRNMLVIPVLCVAMFVIMMRFMKQHQLEMKNIFIIITIVVFYGIGIYHINQPHQSFQYFQYVQPMKYLISYVDDTLKDYKMKPTDEFNIVLYTDNSLESNIADYAEYFYPNAKTVWKSGNEFDETTVNSGFTIFFADDERLDSLQPSTNTKGIYQLVQSASTMNRVFANPRYHNEITWYRKIHTFN